MKVRLTQIEIGEQLTFIRPKPSEDGRVDPSWTLTEAALALRGGKSEKAKELLETAKTELPPDFFYPLLKEDHFFQLYRNDPALARFSE